MKYDVFKKHIVYVFLVVLWLGWSLAWVSFPDPVMDWYISLEQWIYAWSWTVEEQEMLARSIVDEFDDEWRSLVPSGYSIFQASFGDGENLKLGASPYEIWSSWNVLATLERVQLSSIWLWDPNWTSTQPLLDADMVMQDDAPLPSSLYNERFWHEKLWWSSWMRNAARFSIAPWVDIKWFWVWVGDLETRTDWEGWPAEVYLFNENEELIDRNIIVPDEQDQSICGWDEPLCWNQTTRRISFIVPDEITDTIWHIVLVVWDDDAGTWDDTLWYTEHFSLIWPTFVVACEDGDNDGACDLVDVCPEDPFRTNELGCWCGVVDPVFLWDTCVSETNSCWLTVTWSVLCDESCWAIIPEENLCEGNNGTWDISVGWWNWSTDTGDDTIDSNDWNWNESNTWDVSNWNGDSWNDTNTESDAGSFVLPAGLPDTGAFM